MDMYSTKLKYLLLLDLLMSFLGFSQDNFTSFGESGLTLNHKVSDYYSINFSARARYFLYQDSEFTFENRQLDFVHFSTYKVDYNNSISFGIQYRQRENFDDGSNEVRLTQQYNYTKQKFALRFGHRFRFEQRFLDDLTIFRSRYRFVLDFPLDGEKLDIGEPYLITSMEALLSLVKDEKPETDHRTTVQLGWQISKKLKIQTGLEYRFEAFNLETQHVLFVLTSVVLRL